MVFLAAFSLTFSSHLEAVGFYVLKLIKEIVTHGRFVQFISVFDQKKKRSITAGTVTRTRVCSKPEDRTRSAHQTTAPTWPDISFCQTYDYIYILVMRTSVSMTYLTAQMILLL